jgi:sec-independent protein translocase protein TatA
MRIFGIGLPELLIILLICLLVFGAAKLPEIGKALGKTIQEFKKSMKDFGAEEEEKK